MSNKRIDQYPNNDPTLGGDNLFLMYASGHTVNATLTSVKDYVLSAYTVTSSDVVEALGYTPLSAYTDTYVTGGTYTSGEITLKRNDGNLVLIKGLPIGGSGGQLYYFNISNTQTPYKEFSTKATDILEQSTTISVNSGTTSTIQSFLTPSNYPNTPLIPGGVWNFYLHSYKEDVSSSFEIYCDVYKRTTGGTETLLFSTNPVEVGGVSPDEFMVLTNGYYSGSSLSVKDRILIKVQAKNNGPLTKTITLLSEGVEHYSYGITPFNDTNALSCSNIGDCGTIQLIQSDLDKKLNKSGDTMTGVLIVPTIYVNTISAATYQNLPLDLYVTGATYSNNNFTFNNTNGNTFGVSFNSVTGLTINGNLSVNGYTKLSGTTNQIGNFNVTGNTNLNGTVSIKNSDSSNTGTIVLDTSSITSNTAQTASFQNKSGTIALLSDLTTGEPNSKGYLYFTNNVTTTPCALPNTYYKVSGTTLTIPSYLNFFTTGNSTNKLVYTFSPATGTTFTYLKYNITIAVTSSPANIECTFGLRKTTSLGVSSYVPIETTVTTQSTSKPITVTMTGIVGAQYNDYFELFVQQTAVSTNITVSDLSISLFT